MSTPKKKLQCKINLTSCLLLGNDFVIPFFFFLKCIINDKVSNLHLMPGEGIPPRSFQRADRPEAHIAKDVSICLFLFVPSHAHASHSGMG